MAGPGQHRPDGPTRAGAAAPSLPAIRGFLETSFLDWPGRVCAVFFLGGCNFRCPYCHNHPLVLAPQDIPAVPFADCRSRLAPLRAWLGGVCISGGEPTLDADGLAALLAELKGDGWAVKLDTNGSRPEVLSGLIAAGLVDMIAMDVKAPLEAGLYSRCAGVPVELAAIRKSIAIIRNSGLAYQFRATVLPTFHGATDIRAWAAELDSASFVLQNFNPRSTLDPAFAAHSGFSPDRFVELSRLVRPPVGKVDGLLK